MIKLLRLPASLLLLLLTLAGFALRLPLLHRFPLREDEAIYGYWALHAWYVDPLFLHVWPDKPPLFLWLLSLALQIWGHTPATVQAAARLGSIFAATLTIPVLAATARRWWGDAAAVAAAALAAANPFAVSFAPTALTDPLLLLTGSLALAFIVRGRWFWSGFWLGAAIMTKQQGLLLLPLIAGSGWLESDWLEMRSRQGQPRPWTARAAAVGRWLGGLALMVGPILYWDSLRWAVAPSPWDLGAANVGGVTLLPVAAWLERWPGWAALSWYGLASPAAWAAYDLLLAAAVLLAAGRRAPADSWRPALLLSGWALGFLLLHIAASVQIWDRYLLPLVIAQVLLGSWAAAEIMRAWQARAAVHPGRRVEKALAVAALAGLLWIGAGPALQAAQGELPIGGDHGAYTGLDEALAAVDVPDALLFHRELGWQARFALFDAVQAGQVDLRYYPSAVYLADSAAKSPHKQRFVIVPDWAPLPDLPLQLAVRGLYSRIVLRAGHFTVYAVTEQRTAGQPGRDAAWRVCAAEPPGLFESFGAAEVALPEGAPPRWCSIEKKP